MARYTGPKCRLCRREGVKLYLKGDKCYSEKCPLERRRPGPPGERPKKIIKKPTAYALHLREKQKVRRHYMVSETQFRRYFEMAERMEGDTGELLFQLLERRLDNVVYRLKWAPSRAAARQLVAHRHVLVNGRRVSIPSILVRVGDKIELHPDSRDIQPVQLGLKQDRDIPSWLQLDGDQFTAKVVALPTLANVDIPVNPGMIIEFYSK